MSKILIKVKPNKKTGLADISMKSSLSKESTIYNLLICAYDLLGRNEQELMNCLNCIKEDEVQ